MQAYAAFVCSHANCGPQGTSVEPSPSDVGQEQWRGLARLKPHPTLAHPITASEHCAYGPAKVSVSPGADFVPARKSDVQAAFLAA